jgi:hypothetical protein
VKAATTAANDDEPALPRNVHADRLFSAFRNNKLNRRFIAASN